MKTIEINAYAKINLYLDVVGLAENGYHAVETIMHAISLHDTVNVTLDYTVDDTISLTCSDPHLPCDENNLAYRAAKLFQVHHPVGGVSIHIDKRIPIAGGLAGGSTDAAAVLCALNALCGTPYTTESLCALSAPLGADVPFCVAANSGIFAAYGTHFGEVLIFLAPIPCCHLVIAAANEGVSTPWAYSEVDRLPKETPHSPSLMLSAIKEKEPLTEVLSHLYNRFEAAILPKRAEAMQNKEALLRNGAHAAMMSGSGPTVVGFFDTETAAVLACNALTQNGVRAWHGTTLSQRTVSAT